MVTSLPFIKRKHLLNENIDYNFPLLPFLTLFKYKQSINYIFDTSKFYLRWKRVNRKGKIKKASLVANFFLKLHIKSGPLIVIITCFINYKQLKKGDYIFTVDELHIVYVIRKNPLPNLF